MRELKFRVWDGNHNRFIYPDIIELGCGIEYEQYTGLKDKNGQEVYEGDILHIIEDGDYGGEYYGKVNWLESWSIYGISCSTIKEISKSKTNDRVDTIFTRGFLTRRYGSCIELSEMFVEPFCNSFSKVEKIGNIHENPELLE